MSIPHRSHLPPEILDYITDFLHDKRDTLKECCLVSKSWVPRTRKHLFGDIKFHSPAQLELWKKTFPDQTNSPAYHTHTLLIAFPEEVTAADAEKGGWIRSFSRVERLGVHSNPAKDDPMVSLAPFHGFSPVLKYLRILSSTLPNSQIFDLIRSLPILEDLTLGISGIDDVSNLDAPSMRVIQPTSPAFTGTLDLIVFRLLGPTARRLLDLPNGLYFRKLLLAWLHEKDPQWISALVEGCSHALEHLSLKCHLRGNSRPTPIDLSKATKLGDLVFLPVSLDVGWIALALQTITSEHRDLRICIHLPSDYVFVSAGVNIRQIIGEAVCGQWLALDRAIVQQWESRSIRPRVTYIGSIGESVGCLLPGAMKRGMINPVEWRK